MSRQSDYITTARASARKLWDGINELVAAQREYNALDYGTTLATPGGSDNNAGITAAQVGAVVFDTANALAVVLAAGHATNLARIL